MRVPVLLSLLSLLAISPAKSELQKKRQKQRDPAVAVKEAPKAILSITAKDLEKHAKLLASDEYEGRRTATRGQIMAAEYFKKQFKKLGLKPWGDRGKGKKRDWYQRWNVTLDKIVGQESGLFDAKGKKLHKYGAFFLRGKKSGKVNGKLVYVGYGDEEAFDDSAVAGRIAVVVEDLGDVSGVRMARGKVLQMAKRAEDEGAKALILISKRFSNSFNQAANMFTNYPGKPGVTRRGRSRRAMGGPTRISIPTLVLAGHDCKALLRSMKLSLDIAFDSDNDLFVGQVSKGKFKFAYKHKSVKAKALNVIALLEGRSKNKRGECLVYSCHMDHLGLAADGGVFNGADDNASGSASVLEIAEAYAKLPKSKRPARSILFVVVSGEELGLWGSDHFVNNPTWPIEKIIADINMDMLGRSTGKVPSDTVSVTPSYRHNKYSTLVREAEFLGRGFNLKMTNGDRFYRRSDHYNFAKKGIPIVFFCDDEHPDYHQVSDTSDKLEYDKMQNIARLAFLLGYRTANASRKPKELGRQQDW